MNPCKCGSYAINDDPDGKLCDRCWRDEKLAAAEAEITRLKAELEARAVDQAGEMRAEIERLRDAAKQNAITADQWKREAERLAALAAPESEPCEQGGEMREVLERLLSLASAWAAYYAKANRLLDAHPTHREIIDKARAILTREPAEERTCATCALSREDYCESDMDCWGEDAPGWKPKEVRP